MTKSLSKPGATGWVRYRSIGYLGGRGLTFGVGENIVPRGSIAPGKFSLNMDILPSPAVVVCDGRTDVFADGSMDHVVVGPKLEGCPDPGSMFRQLVSKLRMGGHVVVYLRKESPAEGSLFQFDESSIDTLLEGSGAWRKKAQITRDGEMLVVAKKISGKRGTVVPIAPTTGKRACIVRYGALGDMVMITPLIRQLAEDGYEVTMNITPYAAPIIENNPYVSNIIMQERDAIPNPDLGNYWKEWQGDYDRYINLSESIEGTLLKVEGRRDFFTTREWRHANCNKNYYDFTMQLGGYPASTGRRGELYFTGAEWKEAKSFREEYRGKFVVVWALNGSSFHKVYPLMEPVLHDWLARHPDAVVVTVGDPTAQVMEFEHPQVVRAAGRWGLRKVLSLIAHEADLVVGPESMATNIAGCYDVPKITFLSHSSYTNLCKYWINDYSLAPDPSIAPCYGEGIEGGCHQLHYSLNSCCIAQLGDTRTGEVLAEGPKCAMGAISGDILIQTLDLAYDRHNKTNGDPLITEIYNISNRHRISIL